MPTPRYAVAACALLLAACAVPATAQQPSAAANSRHSWQQPHAAVLPNGDLRWTPQPFVFMAGASEGRNSSQLATLLNHLFPIMSARAYFKSNGMCREG